MTRASTGRVLRALRKRQRSSAGSSGRPKDPKLEGSETVSFSSSEAVKPAAPLVRLYVSTMLDVAAARREVETDKLVRGESGA